MNAQFYRSLLDTDGELLYAVLLDGLQKRAERIRIPASPSPAVNRVMGFVLKDHPEIVWTNGGWKGQAGMSSAVFPKYTLGEREVRAFQAEAPVIREALRRTLTLPEAQRVRYVFDFMLENVVYDLSAPHSQDAYGALMEGRAVCRGIAKAMQLLLRLCGLEAITLEGRLCEEAQHVWNIVSLREGNFHLDLTMGYPMFSDLYTRRGLRYDRYAAFCVSDETLRRTHEWDAGSVPIRCPDDLGDLPESCGIYI